MNGTPVVPVSRGEGGRCRMPRTAVATPVGDGEASKMRVDDLIQRGRSQGPLSLSELRTAFEQAGIAPAEGRSILRELTEAGISMADQPAKGKRTVKDPTAKASTAKVARAKTTKKGADEAPQGNGASGSTETDNDAIEAEASANLSDSASASASMASLSVSVD